MGPIGGVCCGLSRVWLVSDRRAEWVCSVVCVLWGWGWRIPPPTPPPPSAVVSSGLFVTNKGLPTETVRARTCCPAVRTVVTAGVPLCVSPKAAPFPCSHAVTARGASVETVTWAS